jgi:hypothetical protein
MRVQLSACFGLRHMQMPMYIWRLMVTKFTQKP